MENLKRQSTKEIIEKYSKKLDSKVNNFSAPQGTSSFSQSYQSFKQEMIPEISRYERWTSSLGSLISLKVSEKDRLKIQKDIVDARLSVTPSQVLTLSAISFLTIFLLTLLATVAIFLISGVLQILFFFLGLIAAIFVFYYTYTMPKRLANAWKLKASSQMVPAVLYTVIFMKHTSNLERAIAFTAENLEGPLALDFKKIFYDVKIGRFSTIKQALDAYLDSWRSYAPEFVEAFHLIESSLYEPSDSRRIQTLEKSLSVILDGIYEKMLKYSREIRSPLTNLYMLGIVLPTLALALLPLASTLLGGAIKFYHTLLLFNFIIPLLVFYLASQVLLKRPGGYGETSILKLNPHYPLFISKKPWIIASLIALPLLIIGLLPFLIQTPLVFSDLGISFFNLADTQLFEFKTTPAGDSFGPFGAFATLLSLFIPLAIALFFSVSYKRKTKLLIKEREKTKALENEFTNSLFQLGNRLGDGTPAEIAFGRVAESTQGQRTHEFFSLVNRNIQSLGFSVERAIFDKKRGAIIYFPSQLISTSMRILVESVKKGLKVAAHSLMSISDYVKNIQKINSRLRDLLAEISSDMKSNMTFLAPLLSGIVVGLSTMITAVLLKLESIQDFSDAGAASSIGNLGQVTSIFNVTEMIPPYFIQITVGIYLVQIIFILTSALTTVDSGKDTLKEKNNLSKNLFRGVFLYVITAAFSIIALTLLASIALSGI